MNFNSPVFLFIFLPVCVLVYLIAERRFKNLILLVASLAFFAWGQWFYIPLMLLIILLNFSMAQQIEKVRGQAEPARNALIVSVGLNLAVLLFFKFLVGYGAGWLSKILPGDVAGLVIKNPLPLGLSYIAFQVISYLFDVSNELCDSEKNFLNFTLYILLFPKIITGPIVRYRDISGSIQSREVTSRSVADGIRRFIRGLAKKVLIADQIARITNPAFALPAPSFTTGIAWVVVLGYAIQLYFDFSGYTDMAIGLGQVFGFHFTENFNYPYISKSIGEFWRRWHMTLSGWFRDYVFYPLEFATRRASELRSVELRSFGGRLVKRLRQPVNVLIVFFLTGLWHGLTINFIIWGLIHGLAIALETLGLGGWLKKAWAPVQHGYALAVILFGWVFFRSPSPAFAVQLLARLAGSTQGIVQLPIVKTMPLPVIENSVWCALIAGALLCMPVIPALRSAWQRVVERRQALSNLAQVGSDLFLFCLLLGSFSALAGTVFAASIYGGF